MSRNWAARQEQRRLHAAIENGIFRRLVLEWQLRHQRIRAMDGAGNACSGASQRTRCEPPPALLQLCCAGRPRVLRRQHPARAGVAVLGCHAESCAPL